MQLFLNLFLPKPPWEVPAFMILCNGLLHNIGYFLPFFLVSCNPARQSHLQLQGHPPLKSCCHVSLVATPPGQSPCFLISTGHPPTYSTRQSCHPSGPPVLSLPVQFLLTLAFLSWQMLVRKSACLSCAILLVALVAGGRTQDCMNLEDDDYMIEISSESLACF